jgi:hypothetical protein
VANAVAKYLARWAEPEVAIAAQIDGSYARSLVVPACREHASLLDGYAAATRTSAGRTLCILVVNGAESAPEGTHRENALLLDAVAERLASVRLLDGPARTLLGTLLPDAMDVLVIDRASPGVCLPRKQGVGLARKIGLDVALALHARERVASRLLFTTDADAVLPEGYFEQPHDDPELGALVFPFWHDAGEDSSVNDATALYELSLRYYVAGLAYAGSPYAFQTLGSALAVTAQAYAAVRGVPKREAAEDFYLLNKVAKVGTVLRATSAPIKIRSRLSNRTPFGTGASVTAGASRDFYAPECFVAVRGAQRALEEFGEHADVARLERALDALGEAPARVASATLRDFGLRDFLDATRREAREPEARLRRIRVWFDGFRTLKLVHALRDALWPSRPWREALVAAPFVPPTDLDASDAITALRVALARDEATAGATARRSVPFSEPARS